MNQQNPWAKAWSNAEKSHRSQELGKAKWKKRIKEGRVFLDATHKYERTFSDKGTGDEKTMNGKEAKELNDSLFDKYLIEMENNVKGRSLERWKVVEKFIDL